MKKVIIGSVFANDDAMQQKWLDLQMRFLAATTRDYDHVVVLNSLPTNDSFEMKTKVLTPPVYDVASRGHIIGLQTLLQYYLKHADEYENFLFLDADAFPVRVGWLPILLKKMEPEEVFLSDGTAASVKPIGKRFEIAAVLRAENLEQRLHASILFVRRDALSRISFEYGVIEDFRGNPEKDVMIPVYQRERRGLALPLLRTNRTNLHTLACGIYYDMFYHHCCGSGRTFAIRSTPYYEGVVKSAVNLDNMTKELMNDPNGFIAKLGWSPDRYGKV
jgi:hypothetical protein